MCNQSYYNARVSVQGVESLGGIADLLRQIEGHSSRFVLFCSLKTFHYKNDKKCKFCV